MPRPVRHRLPVVLVRAGALAALVLGAPAAADEAGSAAQRGRVIVSGVADTFDPVREAVARVAREGGRTYRVIVAGSLGDGIDARRALDAVLDRWRDGSATGSANGADFDPSTDVAILLDVAGRTVAMKVPHGVEVTSGLDTATVERELFSRVFVPRAKDGLYAEGLADLVTATERLIDDRAAAAKRRVEAARVFRTRTLPLGIAGLTAAGVLGGLAVQRARHAGRVRAAREKLAAFKSDVVGLSDLLDEQQERHRMLPHTDPDFQSPMEGQTRAVYDSVQGSIRRYRERWLGLMDVWERAQRQVDGEWFLGTTSAEEAIRLLDSAEARPPLDDVAGECRAPLDSLETAHERARERLTEIDTGSGETIARLDRLAERGRSGGSLQAPLAEIARARGQAAGELEGDPVAAQGRLADAAAALADVNARLDAIEAADDRRQRAIAQAEAVETRVRERRAAGWLLAEEGANPDDQLALVRSECRLAAQLLDAGEPQAATAHLDRAERAAAEVVALVERVAAARQRVEDLLPAGTARLEALAGRREGVVRALEHLSATYAERSWTDVADNVARADEGLARVRTLLLEGRAAAEPERQEYFRAVALLEEAARQADWTEGCQDAITDRRSELDELRSSLPARRDAVRRQVVDLERRLHRQRTDRPRAGERSREAVRLLEVADDGLSAPRPDLPRAAQLVDAADAACARGGQLADEDERLAAQALSDVEETDAALRRIAAWYAEGVQADVRGAAAQLDTARSLLARQRYEDAIAAAGEASRAGRSAYAAATAEAERRRLHRQQEIQRRRMAESFDRMSRGAGPWMIQLPGGPLQGPSPWRSVQGGVRPPAAPSAGRGWSRDIAQVNW
jgi:hypothetical protein